MTKNLSGEFIIRLGNGDERVIPNQFTTIGMQLVLKAAFWQMPQDWYVGLCAHNPIDTLALASIVEPGPTNGYARQTLPLGSVDWPTISNVNGESYVESRDFQFTVSGGMYDTEINRLFLTDGVYVIAISAAMEEGLHQPDETFTSRYRLYFR